MPISRAEFENAYPVLFHVSLARDVAQIKRHGLLSTTALLDLCEIEAEPRSRIENHPRPKAISISHPIHGEFLVNDQAPMQYPGARQMSHRPYLSRVVQIFEQKGVSVADAGAGYQTHWRKARGANQAHRFDVGHAISFRRARYGSLRTFADQLRKYNA
jgi:Family of unknown function (DUF7002)